MGGFGGVSAFLGLSWNFSRDGLLWNYLNVWQVMKAIKVSKLKMPQVAGYIKRNQEMKAFKKMLYDPEYLQTIIVTGPRGSGKSTLVQHCLAGKGGVVLNTRSDFSEEKFAENVMKTIIRVSYAQPGTYVTALLSVALRRLRKSQEELPIFVVEVDHRCTPDQLRSLLILMKHYGADEELIRPIVVLSSSTSAFGLTINEVELICHFTLQFQWDHFCLTGQTWQHITNGINFGRNIHNWSMY